MRVFLSKATPFAEKKKKSLVVGLEVAQLSGTLK